MGKLKISDLEFTLLDGYQGNADLKSYLNVIHDDNLIDYLSKVSKDKIVNIDKSFEFDVDVYYEDRNPCFHINYKNIDYSFDSNGYDELNDVDVYKWVEFIFLNGKPKNSTMTGYEIELTDDNSNSINFY